MGGNKHSFPIFLDLHEPDDRSIGQGVLAIVFLLNIQVASFIGALTFFPFNTPGMDFLAALFLIHSKAFEIPWLRLVHGNAMNFHQ